LDFEDRYCRICGRQLSRPSMLHFDVSIARPATGTSLGLPEPAFVESSQTAGPRSITPAPAPAFGDGVIKRFTAKDKHFLEDHKRLQESFSKPTEPFSPRLPAEAVAPPSTVVAESRKAFVQENDSITNRRGPPQSAKLGDHLTKAATKLPVAPSETETKPELSLTSLIPKTGRPGESQANIHVKTSASEVGATDLIPKLEALEKTETGTDTEALKHRRTGSSALTGYGLAGVGGLSLVLATLFTSTVLAFIGLGLTFWGALLLFIRPRHYVRSDLMDSTALSSLTTIDRIITSLGYIQKGVYIPVDSPEKTVVFIPSQPLKKIPKLEQIERQTFVKDPDGIAMVPPGLALANLF